MFNRPKTTRTVRYEQRGNNIYRITTTKTTSVRHETIRPDVQTNQER